jgi:hypothetical protein
MRKKKFIHTKRVNGKVVIKNFKLFIEMLLFSFGANYTKKYHYKAYTYYRQLKLK